MSFERKSGLYQTTLQGFHFELRLDVDGHLPQNHVSVTLTNQFPSHWIAELNQITPTTWEGSIWFRHGSADIVTVNGQMPDRLRVEWFENDSGEFARLTFRRNFQSLLSIDTARESDYFRTAEFELDNEINVNVLTSYDTHDHPQRPADLLQENLTLQEVFGRVGVNVQFPTESNEFDTSGAGADARWNESELHDAMLANWSRTDGTPWSMWVVSASKFDDDPGRVTFGVMFDSIGNFHRNGTAVFNKSIEDFYPLNHPNREATIRRHKFRTLVHEIGHAFNLAHSWQKKMFVGSSWHPGVFNEPEVRSFMNYPGRVQGGDDAYWADFRFRFSDQELEFIRHAPADFVAMAGTDWFENHADVAIDPNESPIHNGLALQLRFQRPQPIFEYLEPVRVEVKMTNTSNNPIQVPSETLHDTSRTSIFVTRNGGETKQLRPYSRSCYAPSDDLILSPGKSLYGELYLSSAANGWLISDPGQYDVVVSLNSTCKCEGKSDKVLASAHTTLFVRPPALGQRSDYERVSQDYFTDEVGRVLAFGGSRLLVGANTCLKDLSDRLPTSAASKHAQVALHMPDSRTYKLVEVESGKLVLNVQKPRMKEAQDCFKQLLLKDGERVAQTLGHVHFKRVTDKLCDGLEKDEDVESVATFQENILQVMNARKAVLPAEVKNGIQDRISRCKK